MPDKREQRRLRLTFRGETFRADGKVPVSVLASKLQALQVLVYHAAATVNHHHAPRRGPWQNRYRESTELSFIAAHHSDLAIEVELPADTYLVKEVDIAPEAVDLLFNIGKALQSGPQAVQDLDLPRDDRNYLLRALENLLPNAQDDYQIELENCVPSRHPKLTLAPESRQAVRSLLQAEPMLSADVVTLTGDLVKIHVGVGPEKIAIRHRGVEIDCFYGEALRDQVANLMGGSLVEVSGWATLDNDGRVTRMDDVLELETVSTDPIRMTHFEHAGTRYSLRKPVVVTVEYADGLWVYHNETLNLWGYGARREDALEDVHVNFAYLWSEFAEERDSALDEKALELKKALLELRVPETAA